MANSLVQVRVDEQLKEEVTNIYEELGMDLSTAIRIFLKRSVQEQGIFVIAKKLDIVLADAKDVVFYEVVMEKRKRNSTYSQRNIYCNSAGEVRNIRSRNW